MKLKPAKKLIFGSQQTAEDLLEKGIALEAQGKYDDALQDLGIWF